LSAETIIFLVEDGKQADLPHFGQGEISVDDVYITDDLLGILGTALAEVLKKGEADLKNILYLLGSLLLGASLDEIEILVE
jgi:hypothetical protein